MKNFTRFISAFFVALALLCIGCSDDTTADVDTPRDEVDVVITEGSFTISFESNGGTSTDDQTIEAYDSAIAPDDVTLTGYVLDGWYLDEALTQEFNFDLPITEDLALYAKWSAAVYTVTFYYCDGSGTTYETSVEFGESIVAPNSPSILNYTFEGWYTAETEGEEYVFEVIDESLIPADGTISIYAQWSEIPTVATVYYYSAISYDGTTDEVFTTQYLQPGVAVPTITADAIENYSTDGEWYTDIECTQPYDQSTTYDDEDADMVVINLYAKWEINTYTISFVSEFGTAPDPITVEYGSTVESFGTEPEQAGYTLTAWYTGDRIPVKFEMNETVVTSDVTLTAQWTPITYTVVFHFENDAEVDTYTTTADFASIVTAMEDNPVKDGVNLMGWYTEKDGLGEQYTFEALSEEFIPAEGTTIDLYAYWADATVIYYYSSLDYSTTPLLVSTQNLLDNEAATSITPPSISGYTFYGWYTDTDCTQEYDFTTTYPDGSEDVSLYAKWKIQSYTVTFETNCGEEINPITEVEYGTILGDLVTAPYNDGYDLDGWFTDEAFKTEFDVLTDEVTGDMTLYAKWRVADIYVTFVYNNGGTTDDNVVTYMYDNGYGTAEQIEDPAEYADHTFIGWYADEEMTTVYDFDTELTGSVKIYAKWWDHNATDVDIWTLDEFLLFRDLTNQGIALTTNVTLKTDIDLISVCNADLGVNWTPISNSTGTSGDNVFSGTFDGEDHSISNLYSTESGHCRALFSLLGDGAMIKNVHIKNAYIYPASGTINYNASIAGYITGGTIYITNCTTTDGYIRGSNQCGGIVGACAAGLVIFDNCHNDGTTVYVGTNAGGGIIGRMGSSAATSPSKAINCSNSGTISASSYCGGIAGEANNNAEIFGCSNSGDIGASRAVSNQGGIVGYAAFANFSGTAGCKIAACINTGNITATASSSTIGGIIGYVNKTSTITSCYSNCTISGSGAGGIIGGGTSGTYTLSENYYIASPSYGVGSATAAVAGATNLATVSELSSVLSTMNAACSSCGYKFVEGTSNPTLEAL